MVAELVDYAATQHAGKVKFLTLREVDELLTQNVLGGQPLRAAGRPGQRRPSAGPQRRRLHGRGGGQRAGPPDARLVARLSDVDRHRLPRSAGER